MLLKVNSKRPFDCNSTILYLLAYCSGSSPTSARNKTLPFLICDSGVFWINQLNDILEVYDFILADKQGLFAPRRLRDAAAMASEQRLHFIYVKTSYRLYLTRQNFPWLCSRLGLQTSHNLFRGSSGKTHVTAIWRNHTSPIEAHVRSADRNSESFTAPRWANYGR